MVIANLEQFNTPVEYLPGVGPKSAKKLAKLGVETIGDLIYFFPRKYLDYSNIGKISDVTTNKIQETPLRSSSYEGQARYKQISNPKSQITNGTAVIIKGRIVGIGNKKTRRRGFTITEAVVEDDSGILKVVWFNQPYLSKTLYAGKEIILHGKVSWDQFNQSYVMESPDWAERPKIVPMYRETEGVTSYYIAKLISHIKNKIENIQEFLPKAIIEQNKLLELGQAIKILHGPANMAELDKARERMAFDELFLISLRGQVLKQELKKDQAIRVPIEAEVIKKMLNALPYELTYDQRKAAVDIFQDLSGKSFDYKEIAAPSHKGEWLAMTKEESAKPAPDNYHPMNRLLNGDVGSGKTVVAALAAYAAWYQGNNVMLMAPTEILASQHFETFKSLLPKEVEIELIVSSNKNQRKASDPSHHKVLIGTHALLYLEKIPDLALVVVDEQHRFGVNQRQALKELMKGTMVPHFLSMTATPIPRSLQLALFAELDVSVIKEKPKNRKEVKTRVVDEANREKAYQFIRAHVKAGRQVFVICPLIEDTTDKIQDANKSQTSNIKFQNYGSELFDVDRKTVTGEYERLSKDIFPDLRIGLLHGRLKAKEKDEVMSEFSARKLDILVSTSVVEVGVDIPNATIMMIEDAERFGLAQLHQFRGRVGRGEHQSFCFLFSNSIQEKSLERLHIMERVADGFELAEYDLKNRGAGDIFGTDQSGFMDIKFANLSDAVLISKASRSAKELAEEDPKLERNPLLRDKLSEFNSSKHFE